ncbi:MAG: UDP-glucose 4-epimerase [Tardiphaga sp.]|nr:UDP-glucose 4-epimerase [Tardiphaga sp.]
MTTLITGGSGFIGLSIAERLIADGEGVVLFDLKAPAAEMLSRRELAGVVVVTGDVRNAVDIDRALGVTEISRVIHTAAMTPNQQREHDEARRIVDVNIGGTVALLERAAIQPSIKRVVVLSSVAVYGFSKPASSGLFEEDLSPPAPAALYGITKLAAEQAALRIGQLHGMDIRVIRLGPVYGAWESHTGARDALSPHHQILRMALEGREVILPRAMAADWIYSRDAADGIAKVSGATTLRYNTYHVGGGVLSSLTQWCEIIARHIPGFRWKMAESEALGNVIYSLPKDRAPLNIARLMGDTGFQPLHDLEAAARDYLAWLQSGERSPRAAREAGNQ